MLEAEFRASDFNTEDGDALDIEIGIPTDTVVSIVTKKFKITRTSERSYHERPNIILNMTAYEEAKPFMNGDKIWASGSIHHMPNSRGEAPATGRSTYIRFIFPPWIEYSLQTDVCKTNYTTPEVTPGFCGSAKEG